MDLVVNTSAATFKAYRCHSLGDYHDLVIEDLPRQEPAAGEVWVRNHAAAIGFPDMLMVQGHYQFKPPLPFIPGMEFAGEIAAVGTGVQRAVGDKVMATVRFGAFAEYVSTAADNCLPLPETFDFATGATYLIAYKTAYVALVVRGNLKPGETVLIHGAAGGVGLAAVELAKALGAQVIGMATGSHKLDAVRSKGADHVIDYADGSFRKAVKALTAGRGADVIYDPIGGDIFDESLRCIAPFGRMLVIGFASGRIPVVPVNYALIKQYAIIGVRAGAYGRINPQGGREVEQALVEMAAAGTLKPRIHSRVPFTKVVQAFDEIASRKVVGRIVIDIDRWGRAPND
ncbi:MAG: NADPH:quinone oxidoreductase family protein [Gammaproteobacteria bacterium]|nr:NADPH:quinone oxidoreductase family protein [Gammaproteobacteria bacterium]